MNTRYKSIAYLIKQYKRYIKKYKRLKTNFTETKNLLSATFLKKKNWLEKRLQKLMRLLSGLKTNAKKTAAVAGMAGAMALAPNVEAQNFVMRMDNPLYDHQSSGNYLWDADFADIDNDGDMDLFFTAENQTDVLFRENTGTASSPGFGPVQTNPFNISPTTYRHEEINLIDIDGDGDLDMFNTDYGIFRFFENTGNATTPAFASYQAFPFGLGFSPVYGTYGMDYTTFADIDGDGDFDVLGFAEGGWYNYPDGYYYFENTGTPTAPGFQVAPQSLGLAFTGDYFWMDLADMDGDGDMDILGGRYNSSNFPYEEVVFYDNIGTPTNPAFPSTPDINPFHLNMPIGQFIKTEMVDIDADGDLDCFIITEHYKANLFYFENTGTSATPLFADHTSNPYGWSPIIDYLDPLGWFYSAESTFGDIDADGDLDIMMAIARKEVDDTSSFFFHENIGTASAPAFLDERVTPFGLTEVGDVNGPTVDCHSPEFADLDGDGDLDILTNYPYGFSYFENTGTPTNPAFGPENTSPFGLLANYYFHSLDVADMDNDCDIDVIAGDFYGQIIYFENTGTETNAAFATPLIDPFWPTASTYMISPEFADVDNDGDLDALIGDVYGFIYFENTGSAFVPAFSGAQTNPYGLVPLPNYMVYFSPNLVDIDNDGDNDAFFHDFYREIFYYENVDNLSPAPQIACCPGPVAECQDFAVNLDLTNFQASILASDIDNGSTADCGLQSITVNPSLFDCSDVGENTVTLTVTDVNGNTDDCTATVTVGF